MPENLMATQLCALILAWCWDTVRGKPAEAKDRYVQRACSATWEACGLEPTGKTDGRWKRRLELARGLLDDPALALGENPNSPEGKLHQRAVAFCNDAVGRIAGYAKGKADRGRVAKVQERVAQERAAQLGTKH